LIALLEVKAEIALHSELLPAHERILAGLTEFEILALENSSIVPNQQ
jgi:hypothetical protein